MNMRIILMRIINIAVSIESAVAAALKYFRVNSSTARQFTQTAAASVAMVGRERGCLPESHSPIKHFNNFCMRRR